MNIKITTDSTCDLSPQLIAEYGISIVPLSIIKGDGSYLDGVTITPADIFAHMAAGGELCKTAAPSLHAYSELFDALSKEYDAVVHISLGANFSSSYQNACIAAQEISNVCVVDSQNLSTGQGLLVLTACDLAASCQNIAAMVAELRAAAERVEASFLLDRLDYMHKGGRCSSVAALGANLLKLKPCIEVSHGVMQVGKKYRGDFARCVRAYISARLEGRADVDRGRVFITHTPVPDSVRTVARDAVQAFGNFARIYDTDAGCTVSCHCGPGTLGVLYIRRPA
ncbi:EDD domain protein, DegV family [uncultured Eubacteriales bacterium]|uniref:EDD domain protein, DegV family n=1 Tax=uncultured Eubacteriales bacterium TaxID=172733 RepID=A0A212KEL1_9FIRM|nr:EDD domain protein, DegV family [uncultured Eubacteriales bacterium]